MPRADCAFSAAFSFLSRSSSACSASSAIVALLSVGDERQAAVPHAIALRSKVMNASLSHEPRNVSGVVSVGSTARPARMAGLWQWPSATYRSEEHTSELQSLRHLVC